MKTFLPLAVGAILVATATPSLAATDAQFVTEAMKGDNSEVALGHIAEKMGGTEKVRAYGTMLVNDHGKHKLKVAALARTLKVDPTNDITPDAKAASDRLMKLNGAQFDAAFKQHMVEDHQKDIAKYEAQSKATTNAQVRSLTEQTLPTLRLHLKAAQAL